MCLYVWHHQHKICIQGGNIYKHRRRTFFYSASQVDFGYIRFWTKLVVLLGARILHINLWREVKLLLLWLVNLEIPPSYISHSCRILQNWMVGWRKMAIFANCFSCFSFKKFARYCNAHTFVSPVWIFCLLCAFDSVVDLLVLLVGV